VWRVLWLSRPLAINVVSLFVFPLFSFKSHRARMSTYWRLASQVMVGRWRIDWLVSYFVAFSLLCTDRLKVLSMNSLIFSSCLFPCRNFESITKYTDIFVIPFEPELQDRWVKECLSISTSNYWYCWHTKNLATSSCSQTQQSCLFIQISGLVITLTKLPIQG